MDVYQHAASNIAQTEHSIRFPKIHWTAVRPELRNMKFLPQPTVKTDTDIAFS